MKKMSLEERKKWYENHLEQIVLRVWHGAIDNEVHASKFIGCDEAIPNEWYLKTIIVGAELSISQEYFGAAVTEQTLSKQEWLGCDLSELHAEIEDNDYETAIHCLIKDGKIVKKFYSIGTAETVKRAYDFNDVINEAKKINADGIYHFHNHPVTLAAWPSPGDVKIARKLKEVTDKQ